MWIHVCRNILQPVKHKFIYVSSYWSVKKLSNKILYHIGENVDTTERGSHYKPDFLKPYYEIEKS